MKKKVTPGQAILFDSWRKIIEGKSIKFWVNHITGDDANYYAAFAGNDMSHLAKGKIEKLSREEVEELFLSDPYFRDSYLK